MAFIRDLVNYAKFEAQNWWSSVTWTEDSIPNLRCVHCTHAAAMLQPVKGGGETAVVQLHGICCTDMHVVTAAASLLKAGQ